MKPFVFILMAALLLVNPAFEGAPVYASQAKITLKAIGYQPKTHLSSKGTAIYFDMVNKKAKGELAIDWIGGPEVVPERLQFEAMKKGVTDIVAYPCGSVFTAAKALMDWARSLKQQGTSESYLDHMLTFDEYFEFIGAREIRERERQFIVG